MAIRVGLAHTTEYSFDREVSLSPHIIRLRPAPHTRTPIESYSLKISPEDHFLNWQQDPFGNYLARIVFPNKSDYLKIEVNLVAKLTVINPFDFFIESGYEEYPFTYTEKLQKDLNAYLEITDNGPLLQDLLEQVDRSPQETNTFLVQVNRLVNQMLNYEIRMDPGVQSCEKTLTRKSGSCRDFSWLLVQVFRHLGIASRFVSGYSVQLAPDEKPLDGPAGVSQDVTDLHAWTEVYIPGAGWIGLDSTSGLMASEGHIPLACVPDFHNGAPIEGATDVCEVEFAFSNTVTRLKEDPRVTKPYSATQWEAIHELGKKVDKDLFEHDVRLTMGGEPTFVSIDDYESAQWNTRADGAHKRTLGWNLGLNLNKVIGKKGIIHHGQGKWYPGEPLPRWAYTLIWRKDGYPIWNDYNLLDAPFIQRDLTIDHAQSFIKLLSQYLNIHPSFILPAYEDVIYMLWEEGQIPLTDDPLKVDLKDPLSRRNLAQMLERGLDHPLGYVLPIGWDYLNQKWFSCTWQFRRGHLFLIPGNSPVGLRLPLDSIGEPAQIQVERSLFEALPELPKEQAYFRESPIEKQEGPLVRTALSVEERNGKIYVFLPPTAYFEHYLDLINAIEEIAKILQTPVLIEGYAPPKDYRTEQINITPDPGVIEVNIHPASSWEELVDRTDMLYEQARLSRLGTEKFMLDGRHTGTGGGNHITIGAARPYDSPLLRRPDLLRSMITFWQHHPSLSYLFSSAFIGPTSQAPRIDEGREDRLYEMEIAFTQIPHNGEFIPYWMVDRIFRHLLTDITGNTHRAEFCIDKLYSPDSYSGRLGLLELRGFDMPPHKHMSLVQMLLVRAIVSRFWKEPYIHNLVRWGTSLHDKFLLPHFCYQDLEDVLIDLRRAGYEFDMSWFDPFFEFRFPRYGEIQIRDMTLELRMAIEPWHVLGEEMSNVGTARFVDSSLERIQVKLTGMADSRYQLLCNGCVVPLKSTGVQSEYVAGVRYRAWQPPSALHPTIGIDSPLVFDLVDTWNNTVVGGCTYHVSHPGGRSYDTFPVNNYEAESRRGNRFRDTDYSPGVVRYTPMNSRMTSFEANSGIAQPVNNPVNPLINPEFPYTLDLRLAVK